MFRIQMFRIQRIQKIQMFSKEFKCFKNSMFQKFECFKEFKCFERIQRFSKNSHIPATTLYPNKKVFSCGTTICIKNHQVKSMSSSNHYLETHLHAVLASCSLIFLVQWISTQDAKYSGTYS